MTPLKSFRRIAACTALALALPATAMAQIVLKASDVQPAGYPNVVALENMGKKLEAATNGKYKIQMFPGGVLGSEKEMIEQAQIGALQIARISLGPMGPIVPDVNVFNLPFLFRDEAHMRAVIDGPIGKEILDKITASTAKLVALGWMDSGSRSMYTKNPIHTPADLKGQKIRVMGNPMFVETMNAMGGNGISMGHNDTFSALQTGVVDGAENNPPTFFASNQYTAGPKFYSQTTHLIIPELFVMSRITWDKMSTGGCGLWARFGMPPAERLYRILTLSLPKPGPLGQLRLQGRRFPRKSRFRSGKVSYGKVNSAFRPIPMKTQTRPHGPRVRATLIGMGVGLLLAGAAPLAQASDSFSNGLPIYHPNPEVVTGINTAVCTAEPGELSHNTQAGLTAFHSYWITFRVAKTGYISLDTAGSNFDTVLAVYTGTKVNALTKVAGDDDAGGGNRTSKVTFLAKAGTVYRVAIDGFNALEFGLANFNVTGFVPLQAKTWTDVVQSSTTESFRHRHCDHHHHGRRQRRAEAGKAQPPLHHRHGCRRPHPGLHPPHLHSRAAARRAQRDPGRRRARPHGLSLCGHGGVE